MPGALAVAFAVTLVAAFLGGDEAIAPGGDSGSSQPVPPFIGQDHWHASYQFIVCGEQLPPAPFWEAGVHTHDDGIIHIHPFSQSEEGRGARLVKWFEYGAGVLTKDEVRFPGSALTLHSGDRCPNSAIATIQVFVNGERLTDFSEYIPQDGDQIRIEFGSDAGAVRA